MKIHEYIISGVLGALGFWAGESIFSNDSLSSTANNNFSKSQTALINLSSSPQGIRFGVVGDEDGDGHADYISTYTPGVNENRLLFVRQAGYIPFTGAYSSTSSARIMSSEIQARADEVLKSQKGLGKLLNPQ